MVAEDFSVDRAALTRVPLGTKFEAKDPPTRCQVTCLDRSRLDHSLHCDAIRPTATAALHPSTVSATGYPHMGAA